MDRDPVEIVARSLSDWAWRTDAPDAPDGFDFTVAQRSARMSARFALEALEKAGFVVTKPGRRRTAAAQPAQDEGSERPTSDERK